MRKLFQRAVYLAFEMKNLRGEYMANIRRGLLPKVHNLCQDEAITDAVNFIFLVVYQTDVVAAVSFVVERAGRKNCCEANVSQRGIVPR